MICVKNRSYKIFTSELRGKSDFREGDVDHVRKQVEG